jgi:hypothetical protein
MTEITIRVAKNGYMAREAAPVMRDLGIDPGPPYVFNTFSQLLSWLKENLAKPVEGIATPDVRPKSNPKDFFSEYLIGCECRKCSMAIEKATAMNKRFEQ